MEEVKDLVIPAKQEVTYIYNSRLGKYEPFDLVTGQRVETVQSDKSTLLYTTEIGDYICDKVRSGETLKQIVRNLPDISLSMIYAWKAIVPEFKVRLDNARKQRAEAFQDQAIELALSAVGEDPKMVNGIKLAVDTLKWAAEKNDHTAFGKGDDSAGKGNGSSVKIVLNTGVLNKEMPKNIIVDGGGNFIGFEGEQDGHAMGESWGEDGVRRPANEGEEGQGEEGREGSGASGESRGDATTGGIVDGDYFDI